jgi:hypothetical protein
MLNAMGTSCGLVVGIVSVNCVSFKVLFTSVYSKIQAMFINPHVFAPKAMLVSNKLYPKLNRYFNLLISSLPTISTGTYNNNYYLLILNYCYL